MYVDWGDGSVEKFNGNISVLVHTYSSTGTFHAKVSNNISSFAACGNNSSWYGTTTHNRYVFKNMLKTGSHVTNMPANAFYFCAALSSLDFLSSCYTSIASLPNYAFYYCQGIKTLSSLPARIKSLGSNCF